MGKGVRVFVEGMPSFVGLCRLECFIALTRLRRCAGTTRVLSVARPDLDRTVSSLRDRLKMGLFRGSKHGIMLAGYKRTFLISIRRTLSVLSSDVGGLRVAKFKRNHVSVIRLHALDDTIIPGFIGNFLSSAPGGGVSFRFRDSAKLASSVVRKLGRQGCSVTFYSGVSGRPLIRFIPITGRRLMLVMPGKRPLSKGASVGLGRSLACPRVIFSGQDNLERIVSGLFRGYNKCPRVTCSVRRSRKITKLIDTKFNVTIMPQVPVLSSLPISVVRVTAPS